jgi:NADH:ubiquinone oxidoreductase subunit 2 (subunit N)
MLGLFSFVLAIFENEGIKTDFETLKGQIRVNPVAGIALLIALFSIAGFPLLASFPMKVELLEQYSIQPIISIWTVIGMAAMLFAAVKVLITFIAKPNQPAQFSNSVSRLIFITVGAFIIVIMGLIPNVFVGSTWVLIGKLLGLS